MWERKLRVLPTMATALGLWAVEEIDDMGYYDRAKSLHVAQSSQMCEQLVLGEVEMTGRVEGVSYKGEATVVEIEVQCSSFTAGYSIYLPGIGDWGGDSRPATERVGLIPVYESTVANRPDQALLYRLTGDRGRPRRSRPAPRPSTMACPGGGTRWRGGMNNDDEMATFWDTQGRSQATVRLGWSVAPIYGLGPCAPTRLQFTKFLRG